MRDVEAGIDAVLKRLPGRSVESLEKQLSALQEVLRADEAVLDVRLSDELRTAKRRICVATDRRVLIASADETRTTRYEEVADYRLKEKVSGSTAVRLHLRSGLVIDLGAHPEGVAHRIAHWRSPAEVTESKLTVRPAPATRSASTRPAPNAKMICPHCQATGSVTTRRENLPKGVSGGKATGALLTFGLSLWLTGLARHEIATHAHCTNCGADWYF